jgi:HprK-related kinase A
VKLGDLSPAQLRRALSGPGLMLRTGPVVNRIRSRLPQVARGLAIHYAGHPLEPDSAFADFDVGVQRPRGLRRWWRPQVEFRFDELLPFAPLPGDQGFPMLEWGLNWCITHHCHRWLMLHAAVVERDGLAIILPAPPGSGKSTLCAGLIHRGWRLMSDELCLIDPADLGLTAVPRPVSLKNASIDVIGRFAPGSVFSPPVHDTGKGTVAHLRPPASALELAHRRARPGWIVLPRWVAGAPCELTPMPRAAALMALIGNAFNHNVHGGAGFDLLAAVVERCDAFELSYGDLEQATARLAALPAPRPRP